MNLKNLTILVPTHNRPKLFYRLFEIIKKYECEIVINNDSNDVFTIPIGNYKNCRLYHHKFDNLSNIYQFMISCVNTSWFYIIEDDDIPFNVFKAFSDINIKSQIDAICGSYYTFDKKFIKYDLYSKEFQLSQVIFKNKPFDFSFLYDHCDGNCIYNDFYFVKNNIFNPFITNYCFYKQTTDGKDNISFPEYNLNLNCKNCKFVI